MKRWIPPILAGLLVIVLAAALLRGSGDATGPLVGKTAPDFHLQTLDGGDVRLSDLRGRPVIVNFWASWCIPCREEAPLLREIAEQQAEGGLVIVGIMYQDREADARKFIEDYGLTFPSLIDKDLSTAIDYGVGAVPETFLIDRDGVVQRHLRQPLTRELLRDELPKIGVRL